jgi:DNA-binding NarL/FixJ family response regulator
MIRALLIDKDPVAREGLKRMLSPDEDISIAGEAADASGEAEKALAEDYDVVVINISSTDGNALKALKNIRRSRPELPVLVLSTRPEERYAARALRNGASGFVIKEISPMSLAEAIRTLASGERYLPGPLAETLALDRVYARAKSHGKLSDREFQILLLLAGGKGVSEIAGELSLSPKTVSTYKARIIAKMNFSNDADIIRYALEHQLVN